MLDANAVEPKRSAEAHLRYLAASAGLPDARVDEVLRLTGLSEAAKRHAGNFSLGMHQRLGIAAALLGDPKYLFFDEPTNGLDPEGIRWVREFLQQLAAEGRGVLVSSHLLSELSLYVDHIVVIGKGRFIASGSVHDFESMQGESASVTLSAGVTTAALVFIVVGISVYTTEIRSRTIVPTAGAAPDRRDLVGAKAILSGAVGLVAGAVLMLLTTIACLIVLDARGFPLNPINDDDAARAIVGSVFYLAIATLFGLGIGILLNSATSAIAVGILWPLGLESAFQAFLPDWIDEILPFEAGKSLIVASSDHQLPAWEGGGVFSAWSALLVIVGWALFNRRDLSDS